MFTSCVSTPTHFLTWRIALLLQEGRDTLLNSELLTQSSGTSIYSTYRLDVSIRKSFERFLRETGLDRATITVTTVEGQRYVDPSDPDGTFQPGLIYQAPFIEGLASTDSRWRGLKSVDFNTMRRWYRNRSAGGVPTHISWLGSRMYLYPVPSAAYEITIPYARTLVPFAPGSRGAYSPTETYHYRDCVTYNGSSFTYIDHVPSIGNDPSDTTRWKEVEGLNVVDPWETEINCPDTYAYEVIGSGALFNLVKGVPGHPQWSIAGQEFETLIARVKGELSGDGPYIPDRTRMF